VFKNKYGRVFIAIVTIAIIVSLAVVVTIIGSIEQEASIVPPTEPVVPITPLTPPVVGEPKQITLPVAEPAISPPAVVEKEEEVPVVLEAIGLEPKYFGKGYAPSPPIIRNNLLLFGVAWDVPIGTVIFAPFEGMVIRTSRSLPDGESLMSVQVFQPATDEWENASLRFAVAAYKIELLTEEGIEVKQGDPIAKLALSEAIEPLLKEYNRSFNLVFDFMTKDLSDQRFYEWHELLTLAEK